MSVRPTALCALALSAVAAVAAAHPHFSKSIEITIGGGPDPAQVTLSHLTVTFDRKGFDAAKEGDA